MISLKLHNKSKIHAIDSLESPNCCDIAMNPLQCALLSGNTKILRSILRYTGVYFNEEENLDTIVILNDKPLNVKEFYHKSTLRVYRGWIKSISKLQSSKLFNKS